MNSHNFSKDQPTTANRKEKHINDFGLKGLLSVEKCICSALIIKALQLYCSYCDTLILISVQFVTTYTMDILVKTLYLKWNAWGGKHYAYSALIVKTLYL